MTGHPFETDLDKNAANYVPLSPISFLARTAAVFPTRASVIHGEQLFTGHKPKRAATDWPRRWLNMESAKATRSR